jgi:hypothetical protein
VENFFVKPSEDCIIRLYREGDEEELNNIFNQIFNTKRSLEEWNWKFRENLLSHINILTVVEFKGRIIGQYGSFPCRYKYRDRLVNASLVVDNFVLPEFRGGLRGIQWKAWKNGWEVSVEKGMAFGMGFPTPKHYVIGKRILRYSEFAEVPVLYKRLSWRLAVKSRFPFLPDFMTHAVSAFSRLGYRAAAKFGSCKGKQSSTIRRVVAFDEKFDQFWEKVRAQYEILQVRDRTYLQWRYRKPGSEYEIFVSEKGNEMTGYIVLMFRSEGGQEIGHIIDLLADEATGADSDLIRCALLRFISRRVDYVRCWMLRGNSPYKTLRSYGFFERACDQTVKGVCGVFNSEIIDASFIEDSGNWYITMGDADTF